MSTPRSRHRWCNTLRNASRATPENPLPRMEIVSPLWTTTTLSQVWAARVMPTKVSSSCSLRKASVRSENTMPQPNVSPGPSRSTTVIRCAGSTFLRRIAKKSPAGPPPRTLTFMGRSIDDDRLARATVRGLGRKLDDRPGDDLGLDETAGAVEASEGGHGVVERSAGALGDPARTRPGHIGGDEAGADRVDGHAGACGLDGRRTR